jgi:phage tail-like protein
MASTQDPAAATHFRLTIDGDDYGDFTACDGLSLQVQVEAHEEGGNNGYVWQLPTRVTFGTVRLSRPLTSESRKLTKWATDTATSKVDRPTAQVAALRPDGTVVARWGLLEVLPVSWQGPSLDPNAPAVATESVELAHHGFTDTGGA